MATQNKSNTSKNSATSSRERLGSFVLLPADDVPRAGSKTEIVVSPNQCLRVTVFRNPDGELVFAEESK